MVCSRGREANRQQKFVENCSLACLYFGCSYVEYLEKMALMMLNEELNCQVGLNEKADGSAFELYSLVGVRWVKANVDSQGGVVGYWTESSEGIFSKFLFVLK